MNGHALAESIGAIGLFTVLTVVIWQASAILRAKVSSPQEGSYVKLAEASAAAQEHIDLQLREITLLLEDLRSRVVSRERILKEVE
jgi:hypothetical protein